MTGCPVQGWAVWGCVRVAERWPLGWEEVPFAVGWSDTAGLLLGTANQPTFTGCGLRRDTHTAVGTACRGEGSHPSTCDLAQVGGSPRPAVLGLSAVLTVMCQCLKVLRR